MAFLSSVPSVVTQFVLFPIGAGMPNDSSDDMPGMREDMPGMPDDMPGMRMDEDDMTMADEMPNDPRSLLVEVPVWAMRLSQFG